MAFEIRKSEEMWLSDPLSEVTRKERRFLLGLSVVSIVIAHSRLIPTKMSALGIELTTADQNLFLWVVIAVNIYALLVFIVYGGADLIAWRSLWNSARVPQHRKISSTTSEHHEWRPRTDFRTVQKFRAAVDFIFPVLLGTYAIYCVWQTSPRPPLFGD